MIQGSQRSRTGGKGLFDVFIHLHVLHAARKSPVGASELVELLAQRGYKASNQAISALLRRFERCGWLRAHKVRRGIVPLFVATQEGKKALHSARPLVSALLKEISSCSGKLKQRHQAHSAGSYRASPLPSSSKAALNPVASLSAGPRPQ